ncbi:hypothetical protein [Haliangium sp.]|uniref:hypothetical protein n=1 Tax=Haliangium sp. TaxID=2663208 RepID=UPI003D0FD4F6
MLAEFAAAADAIEGAIAIRDGGDELLLVGAPTGRRLSDAIETLRDTWPARFRAAFGDDVPPVTARFVLARCAAGRLRPAREVLGRAIGELEHVDADDARGVRKDLGRLVAGC